MTDFVISTNLVVFGMSTFTGGQTFDGQMIVDLDNAEALLVRQDGDSGDVFVVDTNTPSATLPQANSFISLGPNASATGDIRFGNTRFIAWRNMNNNGDVQALSVDEDDFLNIGSAAALRSRILSPSFVVLTVGPHTIGTATPQNHRQLRLVGNFVSGGQSTSASNFHMETDLTGASGDTTFLAGFAYQGAITTQAVAEVIANVSSMLLDEPFITLGAGSSVTNAQTLLISSAPTEGSVNHAFRIISGSSFLGGKVQIAVDDAEAFFIQKAGGGGPGQDIFKVDTSASGFPPGNIVRVISALFRQEISNAGNAFGASAGLDYVFLRISPSGTISGGASDEAHILLVDGNIQGFSGDTARINVATFTGSVTTQNVAEAVATISQVQIDEPTINLQGSSTVTNAQSLLITGAPTEGTSNYALRVQGGDVLFSDLQLGVGVSSLAGIFQVEIGGNFLSDGGNVFASSLRVATGLIGAAGDTSSLITSRFEGNVTTQAAAESIANIAQVRIADGIITDNLTGGGVITNAQILLLEGTPIEGVNNFALRSTGTAATLFTGPQFVIGRSTVQDFVQFRLGGSFTSGGGSNSVTGAMFASNLTGFSGDVALSHIRAGITGGGSIVTSGAGDSVLAATLWLDEPNITLTPTDAMALAATLYISGAPTEGTSANYALFIDNGSARFDGAVQMFANSTFPNPANTFTFGSGVDQTHTHVAVIGAFTSSGISNHAERLFIGGSLTGFAVDTLSLAGLRMESTITTQGNTDTIADVAQAIFVEPVITIGTGDTVTNAQTVLIVGAPTEGANNYALRVTAGDVLLGGNLAVSGAGPHAIAGTPSGIIGLIISETFTSDGSSTLASGVFITQTLVGASGDTTSLTGVTFISAITTQTETESIANISQVEINEPFITDNLTGDITNAQTLLIVNAPTEGLSNFAIRVISGSVFFGGDLDVAGTTTTVGRIKTVTRQTTTYTVLVTDSVVFGNTDSAGFTATLPAGVSGQTLRIINSGSSGNQLTVAPDGAEDLLGVNSSFTLFDGESLDITFDSTDGWY